jgi:hypothetical protein
MRAKRRTGRRERRRREWATGFDTTATLPHQVSYAFII